MSGVSVIICTYNGSRTISLAIDSILHQRGDIPIQLIVVDNNSNDDTSSIINSYALRATDSTPIIAVNEERQGLIHARRRGVSLAVYDRIIFVDDDNELASDYCSVVYDLFDNNPSIGACGGRAFLPLQGYDHLSKWWSDYAPHYAVGVPSDADGTVDLLWGAGLAVRTHLIRSIFESTYELLLVGRSSSHLSAGDDSEICYLIRMMGYSLHYSTDLVLTHHIHPQRMTETYLCKMKEGFGHSMPYLSMYSSLLESSNVPKWHIDMSNNLFELIKNIGVILKGKNKLYGLSNLYFYRGYLKELISLGPKGYRAVFDKVNKFKNEVNTI